MRGGKGRSTQGKAQAKPKRAGYALGQENGDDALESSDSHHTPASDVSARDVKDAFCPVARTCGGCSRIGEPYGQQLSRKDAYVADLFGEVRSEGAELRPTLGMDEPFHYRNKVTSPFAPGKRGPNGGREILTGMYAAGSHRIVPTDGCLLENEQAQQVIRAIKSIMRKHGVAPYDEDKGTGFMRHAVVRVGHESEEVLVTLVTNEEAFPSSKAFCRELVKRCPFITSIVQNVNTRQTNVILGEREQRLYGPGFILDTLCGLSFRISSRSFYQVNATQTAVLYEQALAFADLGPGQVAIDAYCGTGTIGLVAAKRSGAQVIGVDSVESAIRDARENARHNGIENARFSTADASVFMRDLAAEGQRVDVVFMDPPRAGSTEEFLDALAQLAPARVVYVSCNPETQVRDLRYLEERGYQLRVVQPVDMFPHTDHVETVVLLSGRHRIGSKDEV
ncbi:MAG: 23S rRNA (uracil(1939)-C(5))-methyltransferase RlmD [Eggerthellaceae bacterium]|nr:23S rRNA (uracil(1939)-C(5))-methyltransferase RlmD [Eggerthellaceae bacterium]